MGKVKHIFFDIDGTLVTPNCKMPDSAQKALKLAQKNGHKIYLCTGRPKVNIHDFLLNFGFDGLVAATGAYVEYQNKIILDKTISNCSFKTIMDLMQKYNIGFMIETNTQTLFDFNSLKKFGETFMGKKLDCLSFEDFLAVDGMPFLDSLSNVHIDNDLSSYYKKYKGIYSFTYVDNPLVVKDFAKLMPDDVRVEGASFYCDTTHCGEITVKKCQKYKGIKALLDYLKVDYSDCVVVGDGPNDKDMMKFDGISIAMGNAIPEIKELADYVTSDIEDDGIYNALKHYDII